MQIRLEEPKDYRYVENMTREAFWNKYQPGCDEHFILHQFRSDPAFIPELDLVLEDNGEIVAHIMYCHIHIDCKDGRRIPAILFGPVSVMPKHQGRGYGSHLIRHSLAKAKALGYGAVITEGALAYYQRFGFVSFPLGNPFQMKLELQNGYLDGVQGTAIYPSLYGPDPSEVEAFDQSFPPKTKERRPGQLI